ncbi:MAG: thiamine permease [Spirochaetaceae bacterium]|nr:MAG: thiamine permease [Spirochaetaceae bacterium]
MSNETRNNTSNEAEAPQRNRPLPPALRPGWTMRETVTLAIIGVVFAFLYLGWVQVWLVLQSVAGPLAMDVLMGFWFSGSIFAAWLIRKPFVAFSTAMLTVFVQILAGNPSGAILLLTGLVQGAGSEVPFALTRYKRYSYPVLMASGACTSVFSFIYTWFRFSYWELAGGLVLTMFIIRVVSGVVLGGVLGRVLAGAVHRTGVTSGLAVDYQTRSAE